MRRSKITVLPSSVLACGVAFLPARPITPGFARSHHEPAVHPQCTFRAPVTGAAPMGP
jgi:hypothetical protein